MPKAKKKPAIVDFVQWTGTNLREVIDLIGLHESAQKWTWAEYAAVVAREGLKIFTLEGTMMASIGDYILKGSHGESWPIKPDIFADYYEIIPTPSTATNEAQGDVCECQIDNGDIYPVVTSCGYFSREIEKFHSMDSCMFCGKRIVLKGESK